MSFFFFPRKWENAENCSPGWNEFSVKDMKGKLYLLTVQFHTITSCIMPEACLSQWCLCIRFPTPNINHMKSQTLGIKLNLEELKIIVSVILPESRLCIEHFILMGTIGNAKRKPSVSEFILKL